MMMMEYKVWRRMGNHSRHVGNRYIQFNPDEPPVYYFFEFKTGPNGLQRGPKQITTKQEFFKTNANEYMRLAHKLSYPFVFEKKRKTYLKQTPSFNK